MKAIALVGAATLLVSTVLVSGCGNGNSRCEQVESKLRGCSLITNGVMPCDEPTEAEDRCNFDCLLSADCEQVEAFVCSSVGSIMTCLETCSERFTFRCDDGEEIPEAWVCDFDEDCEDGSDEVACAGGFHCADGLVTIPEDWRCDGFEDCPDFSDEDGCPEFQCADGSGGIPEAFQCDEDEDCPDGSDELGCPAVGELICE